MDAIQLIAEERIRAALEQGDFDDLPGRGKPFDFEDESHIPEELRMAFKLLKNAGFSRDETEDRKEAQDLVEALESCHDEQEKLRQMRKLEVVMERIAGKRRERVALREENPYYAKVMSRVPLAARPERKK